MPLQRVPLFGVRDLRELRTVKRPEGRAPGALRSLFNCIVPVKNSIQMRLVGVGGRFLTSQLVLSVFVWW